MPSKRGESSSEKVAVARLAAQFDGLLEAVPDALIGVDQWGVILFVNHQTEVLFGYDRDELVDGPVEVLVPQASRTVHQAQRAGYLAAPRTRPLGHALELSAQLRDGTTVPVDISLSHVHTAEGLLTIAAVRDLTERKKAEDDRRRLERLASVVEFSGEALIDLTLDGVITSWNPAAERQYDYSSEEMIGTSVERVSPLGRTCEIGAYLAKISDGQPVERLETIQIRQDGTHLPVSLTVSPIRDADGVVSGASVIARDVTVARQAFESARAMIESSLDSLVAISPEGQITDVNEATVKVTGIPREELIGTAFSDCFTEPGMANDIYQLVFAEGMAVDYPLTMRHRDGTPTDVLYNASVYRDANGKVLGVFAAARDLTGQSQTAQSSRSLAAVEGTLALTPHVRRPTGTGH